jgi:hypothetical protein
MSDAKQPEPRPEPPKPKIGDKRPTSNPYYKETVTGYNGDGSPVWRNVKPGEEQR